MSDKETQLLKPISNGPISAKNISNLKSSDGTPLDTKKSMTLCRCGGSSTKPYCDGTHRTNGFDDAKSDDRQPRVVDNYAGKAVTIRDNRGICAHIGHCTDGLPDVFRMKTEPWIDPDATDKEKIISTIKQCPSGALSYSINDELHNSVEREAAVIVSKDGPYFVVGGIEFEEPHGDVTESPEHYALCRCGGSKNKPFCDGTHWYNDFKDDSDWAKNEQSKTAETVPESATAGSEAASDGDEYIEIGSVDDFSEGEGKLIEIEGKNIAIFRSGSDFGAISDVCLHQGGPLSEGELSNGLIECPWHGHKYDFKSGKGAPGSLGDVAAYDVKIEEGKVLVSNNPMNPIPEEPESASPPSSDVYLGKWMRSSDDFESNFQRMQELAMTGKSEITPMRTQKSVPNFDDILFKGGQLFRMPLNEDEPVSLKTIIGKTAKYPLEIDLPFYVSHMSFGALSREAKIALARGTKLVGTLMCSGEGGMLAEERMEADKYIYEIGTAMFSHKDDVIIQADAIEIKIGQAAKPGLGGHLPKEKITDEIAEIRGISKDEDSFSPGRHADINSAEDLKKEVDHLRELTGGKPIGIKFSSGHVEKDMEVALSAKPDFITIDCRGGGTGAGPTFVKDNLAMPPVYAIRRARKYLDSVGSEVTLCVTGGFRDSSDIAKAIAIGADAVALATASMIAIGCQQYRICNTGNCPVGITTQRPELRERFIIEESVKRFVNLYTATANEIETFLRINGRSDISELDLSDVFTTSREIAEYTDIEHA